MCSGALPGAGLQSPRFCPTATKHFFDNDNGFVEVAEYANGELILKGSTRPEWVLKLADYLKRPHESIGGHNEF